MYDWRTSSFSPNNRAHVDRITYEMKGYKSKNIVKRKLSENLREMVVNIVDLWMLL